MKFGAAYLASFVAAFVSAPVLAQGKTGQTDWTKRVTVSAIGGHILGNPLAKHAVVEYVSYTCNHCANFETQSNKVLKSVFVAKGHVNTEVRNYVRDPIDMTAAKLARCGGSAKFFGNHNALMTTQTAWLGIAAKPTSAMKNRWSQGDFTTRMKNIANDLGLYKLMQKRGISKTQADACLANKSSQDKILAMTKYASETVKVTGTPSFVINGKLLDNVHGWNALRAVLVKLPSS